MDCSENKPAWFCAYQHRVHVLLRPIRAPSGAVRGAFTDTVCCFGTRVCPVCTRENTAGFAQENSNSFFILGYVPDQTISPQDQSDKPQTEPTTKQSQHPHLK